MNAGGFYPRYGGWIVGVALLLLPPTLWAAAKALQSTTNEARDWLPRHYAETVEYDAFIERFGADDYVLITWEGGTLDDPRWALLADAVLAESEAADSAGESPFGRVLTGQSMLEELSAAPLRLRRTEAMLRLRGGLLGTDGQQTCAIVHLTETGKRDLRASIETLRRLAVKDAGVPAAQVRLGGLPVVNEAINVAGMATLHREGILAGLIGLAIAWRLFRTLRLTAAVCATGMYSTAASLACVWLSGVAMNGILITMAPLVFVAATSGAIHLANYYRDAVRQDGAAGAATRAVAHAWLPLGLATATTAIGLLSLLYSDLTPIRQFGVFSAIGVVLGCVLTLLLLPSILEVWPGRDQGPAESTASPVDAADPSPSPRWQRLANVVVRRPATFAIAGLALLAVCGAPIARMKTSVDIMRLFPADAEILSTYDWLERHLGYLMPVEIVVRMDNQSDGPNLLERMELIRQIEERIGELPDVGSSLSAVAFAPELSGGAGPGWLRRSVMNKQLGRQYDRFLESGYLVKADGAELWRISARVGPYQDLDYDRVLRDLRGGVAPLIEGRAGVSATYTGVMPVVHKARLSLLRDLLFGLTTDLLLIFVAMIALMRHWSSGLLLLLVSVFPTTIVFGTLVWLGVVVEIGALMAPCVALGVTVDDVIHFLLWFRRGIQQGLDQPRAVLLAYDGCARAMIQSWAILGLGLSVLLFSSFVPNRQFGGAMVALLTVGLAGNLFFLPALLAGPLGRIIARQVQGKTDRSHVGVGSAR